MLDTKNIRKGLKTVLKKTAKDFTGDTTKVKKTNVKK